MNEKKYIEVDEVIKEISRFDGYLDDDMIWRLQHAISKLTVADVRPVKRGKWITRPYMMGNTQYCSLCGENYGMKHNFCPSCGAAMEGI